jgi:hypothetical protein
MSKQFLLPRVYSTVKKDVICSMGEIDQDSCANVSMQNLCSSACINVQGVNKLVIFYYCVMQFFR